LTHNHNFGDVLYSSPQLVTEYNNLSFAAKTKWNLSFLCI